MGLIWEKPIGKLMLVKSIPSGLKVLIKFLILVYKTYFRNMTEKQKQQYLTAQQAREIATTPYREVFTKIKMAAESGKCSLTIGFCTDVSEILKSVGYSVTLTTSYRDSVMKIHRIYSIQW